jgi:hypothetical protein
MLAVEAGIEADRLGELGFGDDFVDRALEVFAARRVGDGAIEAEFHVDSPARGAASPRSPKQRRDDFMVRSRSSWSRNLPTRHVSTFPRSSTAANHLESCRIRQALDGVRRGLFAIAARTFSPSCLAYEGEAEGLMLGHRTAELSTAGARLHDRQ